MNDSAPTDPSKGTEISSKRSSEEEAQNQDTDDDPNNGNDSAPTDPSKGSRKFRKRRSEEEAKLYSTVAVSFHSGTMERLLTSAPLIGLKLFYLVSGRYYNYTIDAIVCL